jgi:hypothetical protein
LAIAVAAVCLLASADSVTARVFPGGGSGARNPAAAAGVAAAISNNNRPYGSYGDYGGVTFNFNSGPSGIGMQSGPSGSPSMRGETDPGASSRAIPNQAQANQNWWFQSQGQQMAGQRAQGYGTSASAGPSFGFEDFYPPPKANMDIIKWPLLLQEPAFASRRTQIEAPYRRSPPGLSAPTTADYRAMAKTAQEMKDMLEWMLQSGLDTNEYNQAEDFLTKLAQEAQEHAQSGGTSAKPQS